MSQWIDNVLVCEDGTLITQSGSVLEIRGKGWEGRKRKGDTPMTDRPRVCQLETDWQARKVADLIASFCIPNVDVLAPAGEKTLTKQEDE
jgi:hypothetical protein